MTAMNAWANAVRYRRDMYPALRPDQKRIAALMTDASVEDLSAHLRRMGRDRLTAAILSVGISNLDWHVSQLVKGEDESAGALADLILDALANLP